MTHRKVRPCSQYRKPLVAALIAACFPTAYADEVISPITQLPSIDVQDVVENYSVKRASTATKTDTAVLDTPASVQVIPREIIEDRQITSIQEAVKTVSGVQTPTSVYYDVFAIRGFSSSSDIYRNGLHLNGIIGAADMAFVDRVEILKGPSSILYGRVQPGGMVNIVTKQPQTEFSASFQQQIGSWGQYRLVGDITGALNEDKSAAYRLMAVYDKGDSYIDYQKHENKAIAAYFSFKPNTRFEGNFQLEYYDQRMTSPAYAAQMIPYVGNRPANVPISWTQNDPVMWSLWPNTVKRTTLGFDWSYSINDEWKLTHKYVYYTADEVQTYLLYQGFNAATGIMSRRISYNPVNRDEYSTSFDLTGKIKVGASIHSVLVGADYFSYDTKFMGYNESGSTLHRVPDLNIYTPVYGNINVAAMQNFFNQASGNVLSKGNTRSRGYYAQDQISIDQRWELLIGGRYDISRALSSQIYGATGSTCYPNCTGALDYRVPTEHQFSPRAGVLYKVTPTVSTYASYSESFGNTNSTASSFNGSRFDPETGIQYEFGAKAELFGGTVTTSATLFNLRLKNRLTPDLAHPGFSLAVGEVSSRGLEYDIAGKVTRNVDLIASYTFDKAVITKDQTTGAGNTIGKYWAGVPLQNLSLWVRYDTAPGSKEGFVFGGGLYLNGQRQGNNTNTVQLPGYGRVDVMAGYRTSAGGHPLTAQLNVQNLFDKHFYEYGGGSYATYGTPRNLMASVKVDL